MPGPGGPPPPDRTLRRPNGRLILAAGIVAMVLGILVYALAPLAPTADPDSAALFDKQRMLAVGRNLFWTGLPVALTGLIVRALWFLAGDEEKPRP
jgi:hypothetical protein